MAKQRAWCSSCGRRARTIPARLNGIFKCNVTNARDEVPHQLTGAGQGGLVFDGRPGRWECVDKLKNDKANGYGGPVNFFKNLFGGRK